MNRCYSDLIKLPTFEERYRYLKLDGNVGRETFGFNRYLNQTLYSSYEWKKFRRNIIVRDSARDLGIEGREIQRFVVIHHLNPITMDDIVNRSPALFDPENVICTTDATHRAIHYGDESLLLLIDTPRFQNDTVPWR